MLRLLCLCDALTEGAESVGASVCFAVFAQTAGRDAAPRFEVFREENGS